MDRLYGTIDADMPKLINLVFSFVFFAGFLTAQQPKMDPMRPDPEMPRPVDAYDTVFLEEMTWIEVRDALRAGKTTVIVATGGIEQNGPYLALGKHNYVLRGTTQSIARKLGNALVAPIVPFVPEGNISPPSGHMLYPGTISLREQTFEALLTDIAESFRTHGFRHVIFVADSGGNVKGMTAVAERLAKDWQGSETTIHYIAEHYDYADVRRFLDSEGIEQVDEGYHDDAAIASQMIVADPMTVRMPQRIAKGKTTINGVDLAPPNGEKIGKKVIEYRANRVVAAIRRATR
jgi:creatinine amidohydrolase/Fe(II)-dependent formamide hydrolase-like protein